jgi:hypothetical protein
MHRHTALPPACSAAGRDCQRRRELLITTHRAVLRAKPGSPAACPWCVTEGRSRRSPPVACGLRWPSPAPLTSGRPALKFRYPEYFDVQPLPGARRIRYGYLAARPLPHAD